MAKRQRLDRLLIERGLVENLEQAQKLILAGRVLLSEQCLDKVGAEVPKDAEIRITTTERYVSRGGEKLAAALDHFELEVCGMNVLDIGASTGGFTDCVLQHGASSVWAVDVGTNQLDWRLRNDPRVHSFEGLNARLTEDLIEIGPIDPLELVLCDVSFISVKPIVQSCFAAFPHFQKMLVLVKPQFELNRGEVSAGGLVPQRSMQLEACARVDTFVREIGLLASEPYGSPVRGQKAGNQEYFLLISHPKSQPS